MLPQEQLVLLLNTTFPTANSLAGTLESFLSAKQQERTILSEKVHVLSQQTPTRIREALTEAANARDTLLKLRASRAHLQEKLLERERSAQFQETLAYLSSAQEKLRRRQAAKGYLNLLLKIDELSSIISKQVEVDPKSALAPYNELRQLASSLQGQTVANGNDDVLAQAKGNLQHLEVYMRETLQQRHTDLSTRLSRKLESALESLGWPNAINVSNKSPEQLHAFRSAFAEMLLLHPPSFSHNDDSKGPEPILAPIEVMLRLPILHFKFHFLGNKPTNRLDKPEWAFTKVLAVLRDYTPFLCGAVQSLLYESGYTRHDAKNEFIRGLLEPVTQKLRLDAPNLLKEPDLLSHAIKETLLFDKALREVHLFTRERGGEWKGCVAVLTDNAEWFRAWLGNELEAAKIRFEDIVKADNAWDLAFATMDDVDETKVTKCAERFVILLEAVTERYNLLPHFPHRMAFFSEVQLALLEDFLQEVRDGIEGHVAASSIPSGWLEEKVEGIQLLCRYITSLQYVADTLREWGEDTFFLTMWDELQKRQAEPNDEGMLFDEVVAAYKRLIGRAEEVVVEGVYQVFADKAWDYDRKRNWVRPPVTPSDILDVSPELCEALEVLSYIMPTVMDNLPPNMQQVVLRKVAGRLDDHLLERVVLRGEFNEAGGTQFKADMVKGVWGGVLRIWTRRVENLFRRTKEATILLTLPATSTDTSAISSASDKLDKSVQWSLSLVGTVVIGEDTKRIAKCLEEIGVSRLSVGEVRKVLNRRVEIRTLWDG
ncbi:hypothetical protein HDV00_002851 [Rhizophlyctis rosea]|nr:hypothetical protein HDV00_002851 [Rhizophlyctis rosea]